MEMKDLIDKKTGVVITYPDNKSPKVSVPVSSFPLNLWREWDADCKLNFNDCRWMKIWNDHLKSQIKEKDEIIDKAMQELQETAEQPEREEKKEGKLGLLNGG